jgi:hypothetical protein
MRNIRTTYLGLIGPSVGLGSRNVRHRDVDSVKGLRGTLLTQDEEDRIDMKDDDVSRQLQVPKDDFRCVE